MILLILFLTSKISNLNVDVVVDMCLYNIDQANAVVELFKNKILKYIFISSVAVYKKTKKFPIKENSELGYWDMFGSYGIDKLNVEKYFDSIEDFPYINLRPTYIIGKNNHLYASRLSSQR